jgi:hypothetical protein
VKRINASTNHLAREDRCTGGWGDEHFYDEVNFLISHNVRAEEDGGKQNRHGDSCVIVEQQQSVLPNRYM